MITFNTEPLSRGPAGPYRERAGTRVRRLPARSPSFAPRAAPACFRVLPP